MGSWARRLLHQDTLNFNADGPGWKSTNLRLYGALVASGLWHESLLEKSDDSGEGDTLVGSHPNRGHDVILQFHDYYCATIHIRRAIGG